MTKHTLEKEYINDMEYRIDSSLKHYQSAIKCIIFIIKFFIL